jgi:hypothetical protein
MVLFGLLLGMKVSTAWAIGIVALVPALMVEVIPPAQPERLARLAIGIAVIVGLSPSASRRSPQSWSCAKATRTLPGPLSSL